MLPELQDARNTLGDERYRIAEALFTRGGVHEEKIGETQLKYLVHDSPSYHVNLSRSAVPCCNCTEYLKNNVCVHTVAALMKAQHTGALNELNHRHAIAAAPRLLASIGDLLPERGTVHLFLNLDITQEYPQQIPKVRVGMLVGDERLYVVRSIPQFIRALHEGENVEFGKGFTFVPEWMHFSQRDQQILVVLEAIISAQHDAGFEYHGTDARMLPIHAPFTDILFSKLKSAGFLLNTRGKEYNIRGIRRGIVPLTFFVEGSLRGITVQGSFPSDMLPLTTSCTYIMIGDAVMEVEEQQRALIRTLWDENIKGTSSYEYSPRESPVVVDVLIPYLKRVGMVEISEDLERMLVHVPLKASVYLDRQGRDITARTVFRYGSREIDPFQPEKIAVTMQRGETLLMRDAEGEHTLLDCLGSYGFVMEGGSVLLSGSDNIYRFVTEGVQELRKHAEVFLSKDFSRLSPRPVRLKAKMAMRGPRLALTFSDDDIPLEDAVPILEAIARKKRYFRLRDGGFLDLSGMEAWQELAGGVSEAAVTTDNLPAGEVDVEAYQSFYLSSLIEGLGDRVEQDEDVARMVSSLTLPDEAEPLPVLAHGELRGYQAFGVRWMQELDRLKMGGVLADDMGLGKTIQAITMILSAHREGDISLIVAPTSLTFNWQKEFQHFAPGLRTCVLSGPNNQRMQTLSRLEAEKDADVLITSYPLIRRDVDAMTGFGFRLVFLDEAQQIKNASSASAMAVKKLHAMSRFALTGTPMENHAGELWSLFDFVLPGYLGQRMQFLRKYAEGQNTDELRRKVMPFMLRRLKADVLDELPDKMETVMSAQMTPEQMKFYQATVAQLRGRVSRALEEKGMGKGRMEVLSALTQLREICCHPILVAEQYTGSSGKLGLLMDILPTLLEAGRRVLIFSQFTSMLQIIQRQLAVFGYETFYLDGQVPAQERIELAERFNSGEGEVFLISLKAGGTGLNLTGADVVIHYDPWWNPATEEQATDRAYRIGQTRKVDVIRLVTHNSIEEQVMDLSRRKRELFDQLIAPGQDLISALTEEEIRSLFEN